MIVVALAVIAATSAFLLVYGLNLLYLSWRAFRLPPPPALSAGAPSESVLIQLPIYNERYVAERVIDATARLDWPADRLEIQVLDDSTDDTVEIAARRVEHWRRRGVRITHVRRGTRAGYKAGALAHGLTLSEAPLVAIFDADFVPAPDFLRRMVPALADQKVAFVQARWAHLNEDYSLFTYLQSLMTDFHFLVEQSVRARLGYPANFNGSAGIWRRAAIDDAGGWRASTLTEDLDLSYRAQLRGWRTAYREDVAVPQELPVSASGYRGQQSRWATGSLQCAAMLLGPVWRSGWRPAAKFQATMHLLGYVAPVAMLLQIACYPLVIAARASGQHVPGLPFLAASSVLSLVPAFGMAVAQARRGRQWSRHLVGLLAWSVLGAGTSLTVLLSIGRAVRGGGEFKRTPKYRIEQPGQEWRTKAYFRGAGAGAGVEMVLGLAGVALLVEVVRYQQPLLGVYTALFTAGFLYLSVTSLLQSVRHLRYEDLALRARALLPRLTAPALVVGAGIGLLIVAQVLPEPFEDSYAHWLLAANLATTGRLQDPLFEMQDTWLPAYSVLAALVLKVVGIWQLGALKVMNVALATATLAVVYRLAGSRRRGMLAVALLALNPIFILTAVEAVAEPLLVLLLLGAAAARRRSVAIVLASLACLTGTKAWLWFGCLAVVLFADWLLRTRTRSGMVRRFAWVAPALAVAIVLQVSFGFATHSVARAAVEVSSGIARGSVPAAPFVRAGQFLGYFALASVPIVALAPFGLARVLRGRLLIVVALPSLLYLGVVAALIFAGIYTGSDRYYYPALPGLALAAAAALDRVKKPLGVQLVPVAAAVVVAVLYIPVLNGLAADNRGLVQAGVTAETLPGALVTDSPAAAYFSHKPPAEIYGSRALPSNRSAAEGWLRSKGVGGLVLENISYYKAHQVFPDLTSGHASAPFTAVGDESSYNVPGGKAVYVYGLGAPGSLRSPPLFDGVNVGLNTGPGPQRGKTAPLAKGLVIVKGGTDVAGEGMGFGVPIALYPDGWHYPGTATVQNLSTGGVTEWRKTFDLDEVGGDHAHDYRFEPGPSVGRVEVTYRVVPGGVQISVRSLGLAPGVKQVAILNEESAAFDNYADASVTQVGAAFGNWEAVKGSWGRLRSGSLGIEWSQDRVPGAQFQAGRERMLPDFDWAGMDYLFGPNFTTVDYTVSIRRAR